MPDSFVPLIAASSPSHESIFASLNAKGAPPVPASAKSAGARPAAASCAKPTVTLQRTGDVVSSIRVQCGCGQVIELACVY